MKKVIVFILVIFCCSSAYTQDLIKEIQKLTLANDSLQKQVIKPLNDSIMKLNSARKAEIVKLQEQVNFLRNDSIESNAKVKNLESSIADLNKNKVKIERDNLQTTVDSLSATVADNEKIISQKNEQIAQEKNLCEQKSMQDKEKGKQEALNPIIQAYNKPFDELIISSTKQTVERDLLIVGSNIDLQKKLLDLQKYFSAEQGLREQYNEQKVVTAKNELTSIEQTELVLNLTDKLSYYKLCSDGLKTTIEKILEIDKQFVANDEYTQETKLNDVLNELAWYFRNYRFNFTDNPYLTEIVLEIIKLKQKDANTDIANLKDKL